MSNNNVVPFKSVNVNVSPLNDFSVITEEEKAALIRLRAEKAGKPVESQQEELERLRAENARLKMKNLKPLTFFVAEKGRIEVKGLHTIGRGMMFTVNGIRRLFEAGDQIEAFIEEHAKELDMYAP